MNFLLEFLKKSILYILLVSKRLAFNSGYGIRLGTNQRHIPRKLRWEKIKDIFGTCLMCAVFRFIILTNGRAGKKENIYLNPGSTILLFIYFFGVNDSKFFCYCYLFVYHIIFPDFVRFIQHAGSHNPHPHLHGVL